MGGLDRNQLTSIGLKVLARLQPNQELRTKNAPFQLPGLTPALPSVSPLRGSPPDCVDDVPSRDPHPVPGQAL